MVYAPPPPVVIDGEAYYEIQAFVAEEGSGATKRYLVHYQGYDESAREWRTVPDLLSDMEKDGFLDLVRDFEKRKSVVVDHRATRAATSRRRSKPRR
jgi:hypothetical protein